MAEYIDRHAFKNDWHLCWHDGKGKVYYEVDHAPTADVVEVRHGEWKLRGGYFQCSVCDGKALLWDVGGTGGFSHEYEQVKSEHCPHCGATMDGKIEVSD